MSNWPWSPSTPSPSSRSCGSGMPPVHGRPSPSSSGPATRRTRSASKRSLPAETGVWIVNTLFAPDLRPGVVERRCRPRRSSRARSASRNAEWPSLRCQTAGARSERPQRADPADAQDQLLVEPHLAAADVQDVGDRPVGVVVVGQVRVEQQHRHAADLGEPDGSGQVAAGQLDASPSAARPTRSRTRRIGSRLEVVVRVVVLLVAVGIDRLAEVALAVEQPDADQRAAPCRRPSSCGRRRGRRGRPSRCPSDSWKPYSAQK